MFWIILAFVFGMALMAFLKRQPDEECRWCKDHYKRVISGLEDEIHGLKSTKGKLSKALQDAAFMKGGYEAR